MASCKDLTAGRIPNWESSISDALFRLVCHSGSEEEEDDSLFQ